MDRKDIDADIEKLCSEEFLKDLYNFIVPLTPQLKHRELDEEVSTALTKHLLTQILREGTVETLHILIAAGSHAASIDLLKQCGIVYVLAKCIGEFIDKEGIKALSKALKEGATAGATAGAMTPAVATASNNNTVRQCAKETFKGTARESLNQGAKKATFKVAGKAAKQALKTSARSTVVIGIAVETALYSIGMANAIHKYSKDEINGKQLTKIFVVETSKSVGSASGGIGGSLAGLAAGAAIGTVVPVIGTTIGAAVGGIVGGIGGGIAGSLAGKGLGTLLSWPIKTDK